MDEPQPEELADVRGLAHLRHRRDAVPGRRELALEPGQPVLPSFASDFSAWQIEPGCTFAQLSADHDFSSRRTT